ILAPRHSSRTPLSLHDALPILADTWRGGREVALKVVPEDDGPARAALEREFGWLRRLRHPHVVAAGDFGHCRDSRLVYFTLEHRSEEHTSELQSRFDLVCRLLL